MIKFISASKMTVRAAAIAALIASTLAAGVAGASDSFYDRCMKGDCDSWPVVYKLPGNCFKTFSQETRKDGATVIRVQTTCEYTQAQRDRMAKEGR